MGWIIFIIIICVLYSIGKNYEKSAESKHIRISIDTDYTAPISYTKVEKSKNSSPGVWISSAEKVTIGDKKITRGLFYFGGVLEGERYGGMESSLVDNGLLISEAPYTFSDDSLDYWPSFQNLSPLCRGAYIAWLASDRDMSDVPLGYLFIYFYGLERRIVLDYKKKGIDHKECSEICEEVLRLKSIYGDNYSFNSYSSRLLDYVSIMYPSSFCLADDEIVNSIYSDVFKVKLARLVQNNKPLSPELAYAWILNHPYNNLRTPARRCPLEFRTLFTLKYSKAYGDGMIIKPNKTILKLDYRPASPSLNYFEFGPSGLCDPTVLSTPVRKLVKIATQSTDELDAYSRYLGKENTNKKDIEAIVLLPNELIGELDILLIKDFGTWAEDIITNKEGMCSFKDFWKQTQLPMPTRVNKKEQKLICNLFEKSGYSLAPHPTLHKSILGTEDPIVIYKAETKDLVENSTVFDDVAVKLRLGSIIANADLKIHSNEVSYLNGIIQSNDKLSPQEKVSLMAYLKWLLNSSSSFKGLKTSLGNLTDKDKDVVRSLLINVALSDGKIDPSEVKEIEKLYSLLGFDRTTVPADIHALSSRRPERDNENERTLAQANKKQSFKLDDKILDLHETETRTAQNILSEIFSEEDEIQDTEEGNKSKELTLQEKALAIYEFVSEKKKMERSKFENICAEHGFFVEAAIDSINEWAYDKVGAPVIEDNTDIIIDQEIAVELKEIEEI